MRLREFFYSEESTGKKLEEIIRDEFKQTPKSTAFTPDGGRDASLDLYIELLKNDVEANLKKCGKLNLTIEEHEAFCHLLNNNSIVIRPADKESGIIIMDKDAFIQSLQQEMEQSSSYEATEVGVTNESKKKKKKKK